MVLIDDGGGQNGRCKVSLNQRLNVSSRTNSRSYYISRDDGQSYTWSSESSLDNNEFIFFLKNTSATLKLYVDHVRVGAANSSKFLVQKLDSGTATGATVTAVNLNLASGNSAAATSLGNAAITGSLTTTTVDFKRVNTSEDGLIIFDDVFSLSQNDSIVVQYSGSQGDVNCTVRGYFDIE